MYSISEMSKLTGITTYTLRYYEKIGLLPSPARLKPNRVRRYDDQDLRFIQFIYGLKQTGMKLKDIALFAEDGCLLTEDNQEKECIDGTLHKRIEILDEHIDLLEQQIEQLKKVKALAHEKKSIYATMLNEQTDSSTKEI